MNPEPNAIPQSPQAWSEAIIAKAKSLGFEKVGIITIGQLKNSDFFKGSVSHLNDWLSLGYQADMQWMVTHFDKREFPETLVDNTQSIVCVGMNYFNPDAYDANDPKALKIAKYARGTDYHTVVKKRLKALLEWVQELDPTVTGRPLTDSAPILERPLAQLAGIGWQGKNGNVLTPDMGSFLFLGELFLSLPLEPSMAQEMPGCGNCTRCIDACPTDAIEYEPGTKYGVVNAGKCLSYWTIEYKGEMIPEDIQTHLNGWIFGCDICQDVCPWNIKFSTPTKEPLFESRPWNALPNADEILALDEKTFILRYQKSPIKRPKLAGFQRNVRAATEDNTGHDASSGVK